AVVVLGIATTMRFRPGRMPRFVTLGLHRSVSLLAVVFLGIHIATAIADSYAKVGVAQVVVPLPSAKYGLFLGMGALSLDLIAAVVLTSLVRQHLSQRVWKGIHWLAYASWPVAFLHSVGIGTDKASGWFVDTAVACASVIVVADGTEGEPASWKDKVLLAESPHLVIDGAVIAARIVGANNAVLAIGRANRTALERLSRALADRSDRIDIRVETVPDRFVAG